jgi:hypothetical protein
MKMMNASKQRWEKAPKWIKRLIIGIFISAGIVLLGLILGNVIQWIWNALMPGIFNLPEITYWQAVGIFIFARIIFGCSFGSDNNKKDKPSKDKTDNQDDNGHKTKDDVKNWEHYNEWWEKEGKNAFDDYVNKKAD